MPRESKRRKVSRQTDDLGNDKKVQFNGTDQPANHNEVQLNGTDDPNPDSGPQYWLMKAEPESRLVKGIDVKFSIDDLKAMKSSPWDGVRNPEARNNMKSMKVGDLAFFYHSNCKTPGIVGIARIVKKAYPDHTAFDPKHPYFDAKSVDKENPKWYMVDMEYVKHLDRMIPLSEIKSYGTMELKDLPLVRRGRLSVAKVDEKDWNFILELASKPIEEET